MFQLEVVIVIIGLWTETNLLHIYFNLLCLLFLLTLLQLIKKFRVINDSTNRGLRVWRDFHEIHLTLFGKL